MKRGRLKRPLQWIVTIVLLVIIVTYIAISARITAQTTDTNRGVAASKEPGPSGSPKASQQNTPTTTKSNHNSLGQGGELLHVTLSNPAVLPQGSIRSSESAKEHLVSGTKRIADNVEGVGATGTEEGGMFSFCDNGILKQKLKDYTTAMKKGSVTWICEGSCGGWGDRLKGMVSAFAVALLTGREFIIRYNHPSDLKKFFTPYTFNRVTPVDWTKVSPGGASKPTVRIMDTPPRNGADLLLKWADSFFLQTNQDLIGWLLSLPRISATMKSSGLGSCKDISCCMKCLFNVLFQPSSTLSAQLESIVSRHPNYVAIQVRSGGGVIKSWKDPMRTSPFVIERHFDVVDHIIESGRAQMQYKSVVKVLHNVTCKGCDVFFTGDSDSVEQSFKRRFTNGFVSPGPIVHIDRSKETTNTMDEGFRRVLLDFLLIGRARLAIISNSGFSYTSVWAVRKDCVVVRMNKERTNYFVHKFSFKDVFSSWGNISSEALPLH